MSSPTLNFAIIGTGAITQLHIQSLQEIPNVKLVALCSSSPERAAKKQEETGIPCYYQIETLFDNHQVDAISICTFSGNHLEACRAAAERGIHVITEKPLEVSLERADEMIALCEKNKVKFGCIFQSRFKPDYQRLKEIIHSGQLGTLFHANAYIKWYRDESYYQSSPWKGTLEGDGGAALINQGIHTIDLLTDIMGDAEQVYGQVKTVYHDIEGEDLGMAIVNFKNGQTATIQGSTAMYPGYPERLEVYGSLGSAILEGGNLVAFETKSEKGEAKSKESTGSGASDPMSISYLYHKLQLEDFAQAIREDRPPLITGKEGRKSLALIQGIYTSSKKQSPVTL